MSTPLLRSTGRHYKAGVTGQDYATHPPMNSSNWLRAIAYACISELSARGDGSDRFYNSDMYRSCDIDSESWVSCREK
jgi:hypothetical protein